MNKKFKNRIKRTIPLFLAIFTVFILFTIAQEAEPEGEGTEPPAEPEAPPEPILPQINIIIPEFIIKKTMTIEGSTEPFSSVELHIDGDVNKGGWLTPEFTGAEGRISFTGINIGEEGTTHAIKLWVQNPEGVTNQVEYTTTIDSAPPDLKLSDIPSLITAKELNITGTVNEYSDIVFYVLQGDKDTTAPAKVSGIKLEKADKNLIQFSWTESEAEDFSKYVIYRDNVPIAVTPADQTDYTTFPDSVVNSNTAYTYQVAAMDKAGNIGFRSDALSATTLEGGFTEIPSPEPIGLSVTAEPTIKINTSRRFNITLRFEKDSIYRIKIEAVDKAGNKAELLKKILVDAEPPEIEILSPENGAFFFEHYADEIDITGETEPNITVALYIERTPFGHMNATFEIAGISNEIQDLKDADLKADCKLRIKGVDYCGTSPDYETTSDSDGNFKFKKVDLTSTLALAMSAQMVSPSDLDTGRDTQESKDARLLFIASDTAGHKGTALTNYRIGTCWSGNFTWETTPLIYMQSPTFLSTERLSEGTETLYFAFNFSYVGTADIDTARISSVSLTKACDKSLKNDPRFNHSCNILRSCPPGRSSSDKSLWYFACPLSPLEGMNTWVEKDWKSFFNSITNEMTFPFKVRITYRENGQTKRQTSCEEITYVVDNSRIDFRKLPDWMLYDAVDFMRKSNEKLTEFTEKYVRPALDWTGMGCMSAYGLKFGATIYRRFTCSAEKLENIVKGIQGITGTPLTPQQEKCKLCGGGVSSFNDLTNECLKACAPKCASAWQKEESLYSTYRALCDRVFCHTSPAGWTKDKEDQQIVDAKRKETGECGSIDVGVQGQPIRVQGCAQLKKERFSEFMKYAVNPFDQCLVVDKRVDNNKILSYVYTFANQNPLLTRNNIYKLKPNENRPSRNIIYAVKQNEKNYLTSEPLTCEEVCNQGGYKGMVSRMLVTLKGEDKPVEIDPFQLANALDVKEPETTEDGKLVYTGTGTGRKKVYDAVTTGTARETISKGRLLDGKEVTDVEFVTRAPKDPSAVSKEGYWKCTTVNKCNALNDRVIKKKDGTPVPETIDMEFSGLGLKDYKQYKATPSGYTDGCFPGEYDSPAEIITQLGKEKGKEDLRRECCCIGESEIETGKYFTANDKKDGQPVFTDDEKTKEGYPEFSYRYYNLGLNGNFQTDEQHHLYNPQRYVTGRDQWGCFGQKNVFLKPYKLDEDKTVESGKVMHDPFKSHISAFQCGCISGIYNRVQMVKNILTAMENCLIEVRETGTADSGVCKEIFSQYLCSMMWRAIQYTRTGCIGGDQGTGLMESNNQIASAFGRGMDAVWGSVDDMGTELGQEYGNARLNNLIGIGEEGVARKACLAAFGYDWDISFREILDTAYAAPMATLVIAPTRSREYLTFNPDSSQATYEYRASWLINPGCDMENYNVYLSCVSGNEISKPELGVKCDDQYSCDCQDLPSEQITNFYDGRSLAANVLEDISSNGGGPKTSPYRYDHLKFVLRPDRAISDDIKENCFPEGHEDGVFYRPIRDKSATDIAACHADLTTGRFICPQGALFWGQKGEAHFLSNEINGDNPEELRGIMEIEQGEPLRISSKIHKADGPDVCLKITVEDEAGTYEQDYMPVTVGGTYTYPAIEVLSGDEMAVRVPGKLTAEPNLIGKKFSGNQNYIDGANFIVTFYDEDDSEEIELCRGENPSKDKYKIGDGIKKDIAEICSYNNNKVILSSDGITVEITGVVLPFKSKGVPGDKREESRAYKITATKSAKKEEFKDITLELVRLKAGKKLYATGDDCNPADIIEYKNSLQRIQFNNKVKVVAAITPTAAPVSSYTTGGRTYNLGDKIAQLDTNAYEGLPVGSKVEIPDKRIAEKEADGNWYINSVPYTNTNMAALWIDTTITEIGTPAAALKPAAPVEYKLADDLKSSPPGIAYLNDKEEIDNLPIGTEKLFVFGGFYFLKAADNKLYYMSDYTYANGIPYRGVHDNQNYAIEDKKSSNPIRVKEYFIRVYSIFSDKSHRNIYDEKANKLEVIGDRFRYEGKWYRFEGDDIVETSAPTTLQIHPSTDQDIKDIMNANKATFIGWANGAFGEFNKIMFTKGMDGDIYFNRQGDKIFVNTRLENTFAQIQGYKATPIPVEYNTDICRCYLNKDTGRMFSQDTGEEFSKSGDYYHCVDEEAGTDTYIKYVSGRIIEMPEHGWVKELVSSGKISQEFLTKTKQVATDLNADYLALLSIMDFESNIIPDMPNAAKSGAVGLIQFNNERRKQLLNTRPYSISAEKMTNTESNLRKKYTTIVPDVFSKMEQSKDNLKPEYKPTFIKFAGMSAVEQMEYVKLYFIQVKNEHPKLNYEEPVHLALAVIGPSYINSIEDIDDIIIPYSAKTDSTYYKNRHVDTTSPKGISAKEYVQKALEKYMGVKKITMTELEEATTV